MSESAPTPSRTHRRGASLRRHKALGVLAAVAVALALALGGWVVYLDRQLAEVPRFDAGLDSHDSPPAVTGAAADAVNILLVGVDNPGGDVTEALDDGGTWTPGEFRTDTIMLLHLSADRESAQLISIPRDSWVPIEGHGRAKINAAFSYGGPDLLVDTVEELTAIRLDHVVVVGLTGFKGITETVGGVDIELPGGGTQHLEGESALAYVRERKSLDDGDLGRIVRQQNFLRAVLAKTVSRGTLTNPAKVTSLVAQLSEFLAVDEALSGGEMRELALGARGLRPRDITFATIPTEGYGTSADGQSYVVVDAEEVRALFDAVARDRFDQWYSDNPIDELPPPGEVG